METTEKGHGRIEIRRLWASTDLKGYVPFPYAEQVVRIERITTNLTGGLVKGRKSTTEVCFGITSLNEQAGSPAWLSDLARGQWVIENRLHHVRDMTFDEDRSQVRKGNRPHVLASIRNLAISLLRLVGATNIAAATRHLARKVTKVLQLIGV